MDKKVILAFALSFVLIVGVIFINNKFYPQPEQEIVENSATVESVVDVEPEPEVEVEIDSQVETVIDDVSIPAEDVVFENDLFRAVLTTAGGEIKSFIVKNEENSEERVEMVLNDGTNENTLQLSFSDTRSGNIDSIFDLDISNNGYTYTFTKSFSIDGSDPFIVTKTYTFKEDEYMFDLSINIENTVNEALPLNYNGLAYTLTYGPQIGPNFEKLDGRYAYRKFYTFNDGKSKERKIKGKNNYTAVFDESFDWAAITGKYFAVVIMPDRRNSILSIENGPNNGLENSAYLSISRPSTTTTSISDSYTIFIGPKSKKVMDMYDEDGFKKLQGGFIKPFEQFLKWSLDKIYFVVRNYGIAIIILTILLKLALYPITKKSFASTSKMQAIQPKVAELKEKYKDDPQRLNKETMELYQKEGVSPLGGCLPMLLQMPILISVYQMISNSFDLRGAVFIPGWIPDLSAPEFVYIFENFEIPILGDAIRLLPIIYLGTQLISMKFTQAPQAQGQSGMQQKMFTLIMPIMFFFMLYNLPSGLFVYWIVMNIATTLQQLYINKKKKNEPETKGGMKKAKVVKRKK